MAVRREEQVPDLVRDHPPEHHRDVHQARLRDTRSAVIERVGERVPARERSPACIRSRLRRRVGVDEHHGQLPRHPSLAHRSRDRNREPALGPDNLHVRRREGPLDDRLGSGEFMRRHICPIVDVEHDSGPRCAQSGYRGSRRGHERPRRHQPPLRFPHAVAPSPVKAERRGPEWTSGKGVGFGHVGMPTAVTDLLLAWRGGDETALDRLVPLVHDELQPHRAALHGGRNDPAATLQATALVNEAFLRLVDVQRVELAESHALPGDGGATDAARAGRCRASEAVPRSGAATSLRVTFDEALVGGPTRPATLRAGSTTRSTRWRRSMNGSAASSRCASSAA